MSSLVVQGSVTWVSSKILVILGMTTAKRISMMAPPTTAMAAG